MNVVYLLQGHPHTNNHRKKYQNKQYQKAMDELTTFVYIGDNEHDDAADGVTQLAITLAGKRFAEVKATKNFMWGRR